MCKLTNTLSPSPKGFQCPKIFGLRLREVRGLGLGHPKSSGVDVSKSKSIAKRFWVIELSVFVAKIIDNDNLIFQYLNKIPGFEPKFNFFFENFNI
jgi:hypothetical protein